MWAPAPDLKGQQFGLWIVQGKGEPVGVRRRPVWICRCSCGTIKPVRPEALLNGRSKSCGCATQRFRKTKLEKRFSLVNQRFGRLFVLWRAGSKKYGDQTRQSGVNAVWECKCDCGKIIKVLSKELRAGKDNCGCENYLPAGQAIRNARLSEYKRCAAERELVWEISDERFDELIHGNCHFCGVEPLQVARVKNCKGTLVYNGIDRLNNSIGYVEGNVVSACFVCNSMKRVMSTEAFIAHLRKIIQHCDNKNVLKAGV
jgi:hypothetical protein